MAKVYFEKLSALLEELQIEQEVTKPMEVKYFFSGAALYINKTICASWSPAGLAFKLEEQEASKLIKSGKAIPLKYFPKGHVKWATLYLMCRMKRKLVTGKSISLNQHNWRNQ